MSQPTAAPQIDRDRVVRHLGNPPGLRDLRSADLLAVLEYAERAGGIDAATDVPSLLEAAAGLVGADSASLMRVNLRTGHEEVVVWPTVGGDSDLLQQYAEVSRTHPLRPPLAVQSRSRSRRPAPIRISDVLSRRQWRATPVHAASHRGIDDQVCALVAARQDTIQLLALSRYRGSFTDRQVALLDGARSHLAAAVHRIGPQLVPTLQIAPVVTPVLAPVALLRPGTAAGMEPPAAGRPTGVPTARQREILALVADGLTDAQIGRRLGLSAATVSKHLTRSYARLGVPNRAAAARLVASDPLLRTG